MSVLSTAVLLCRKRASGLVVSLSSYEEVTRASIGGDSD